jgi:hypothetical protein
MRKENLSPSIPCPAPTELFTSERAPIMSTSPRIAAKLLAVTAAAAATVSIGLAAATPAAADNGKGNPFTISGGTTGPTTAAAQLKQRRVSPFERFEDAFDRFFHIPDRDDQRLAAQRAAN